MKAVWMCVGCHTKHQIKVTSDDEALTIKLECPCGTRNTREKRLSYNMATQTLNIVQKRQLERR